MAAGNYRLFGIRTIEWAASAEHRGTGPQLVDAMLATEAELALVATNGKACVALDGAGREVSSDSPTVMRLIERKRSGFAVHVYLDEAQTQALGATFRAERLAAEDAAFQAMMSAIALGATAP